MTKAKTVNGEMTFESQYFNDLLNFDEMIRNKKEDLEAKQTDLQNTLKTLEEDYRTKTAEGEDTSKLVKDIAKNEDELKGVTKELELMNKDGFKQHELAQKVIDEYGEYAKKTEQERENIHQEQKRIERETKERLQELDKMKHELEFACNRFAKQTYVHALEYADMSDREIEKRRNHIFNGHI